jgi:hypothetical protein
MKCKITIVFIFLTNQLLAQSKSEKQLFASFVLVCNAYKQLPLQLTVTYNKASNFPLREIDSKVQEGVFYFAKGAGYIKFGELEQIITDSLALVVMQGIKQMLLSVNNNDMGAQLNKMMQMPGNDSSISILAKKYTITQKVVDKTTSLLHITSKQKINSSDLPVEEITAYYTPQNMNPQKIETIKRGLVNKEKATDKTIVATTVSIPQKGDYLVKEETTFFVYKTITHNANEAMPVLLSDRIEKDGASGYVPVKAYEGYKLVVN